MLAAIDNNFAVMNDFIITATGELDSNGIPSGKENQVGNDFKLSVGFCGKGGQTAPVGDGGPHTRILNALVGGMG